ncbi:Rv3654c family TadE-like protein [Streptomyces sp. NPDC057579]|uniref:Rv3654c family TadE-like protein n=1 Tax=Streptomyces sp. NPDC057579 TaxID=3346172 RepID=UPI0036BCB494
MRRKRCGDAGSATVWTVFAAAALCAVFAGLMAVGQAVAARHRAGAAADLAALAAADEALRGPAAACATARRVAAGQHTRVVRCAVAELIADVTVEAGGGPFTSRVRSRAGPTAGAPDTGAVVDGGPAGERGPAGGTGAVAGAGAVRGTGRAVGAGPVSGAVGKPPPTRRPSPARTLAAPRGAGGPPRTGAGARHIRSTPPRAHPQGMAGALPPRAGGGKAPGPARGQAPGVRPPALGGH